MKHFLVRLAGLLAIAALSACVQAAGRPTTTGTVGTAVAPAAAEDPQSMN